MDSHRVGYIYYQPWDWKTNQDRWADLEAIGRQVLAMIGDTFYRSDHAWHESLSLEKGVWNKYTRWIYIAFLFRTLMIPKGERKYLAVGSKAWNERYLEYKKVERTWVWWEATTSLYPGYLNTVEKRREMKTQIKRHLNDSIARYHKRDDWVTWSTRHSDIKVEPINLIFDETDEFNGVLKNFNIKGMREYKQCFCHQHGVPTSCGHTWRGKPKILNLTDDR